MSNQHSSDTYQTLQNHVPVNSGSIDRLNVQALVFRFSSLEDIHLASFRIKEKNCRKSIYQIHYGMIFLKIVLYFLALVRNLINNH